MTIGTTRLSSKGQVVIPNNVRGELGLEEGDDLVVISKEGQKSSQNFRKNLQKLVAGITLSFAPFKQPLPVSINFFLDGFYYLFTTGPEKM